MHRKDLGACHDWEVQKLLPLLLCSVLKTSMRTMGIRNMISWLRMYSISLESSIPVFFTKVACGALSTQTDS